MLEFINEYIGVKIMENKYKSGDIVYFVSNGIFVKEAKVIRCAGGFVTIKFDKSNTGEGPSGIRVRESKIYATKEEADAVAKQNHNNDLRLSR